MVTIRKMSASEEKNIRKLSRLHTRAFPDFFLTQLGVNFLDLSDAKYLSRSFNSRISQSTEESLKKVCRYSV